MFGSIDPFIRYTAVFSLLFTLSFSAAAQDDCLVCYNYDAAGNRVKRYWYCLHGNEEKMLHAQGPLESNGLTVFPVPANTGVTIRLENAVENATLEVCDAQGKVLVSERLTGTAYELNVTDLSNGIYRLRVIKDQEYFLSSFTVER